MKLDDVLMLARAGYSKADIAALLGSNPAPAPTTPKAAPLTGAPPLPGDVATNVTASASSPSAPSAPDWGAMAQSIAALTARLDTLATPTAGSLGGDTADAVSVDDIIRAAITPAVPDAAPDFSKGV